MGVRDWFRRPEPTEDEQRSGRTYVTINGTRIPLNDGYGYGGIEPNPNPMSASRPSIQGDLASIVAHAQPHSVISAAVLARQLVMSQLQFKYRKHSDNALWGNGSLSVLERPSGRTGGQLTLPRLMMQSEQAACFTGNVYIFRDVAAGRLRMLRPDWTTQILGSVSSAAAVESAAAASEDERAEALAYALDTEMIGVRYQPPKSKPTYISSEYVAHWAPEPHPLTPWLGAAPVSSVVKELAGDEQIDVYVDKFFENGGSPRLLFQLQDDVPPALAAEYKALASDDMQGVGSAYESIWFGGGTDAKVIGSKLSELGHKELRGEIETRIASRMRVPAVILGISEGMSGSALNAGNYGQTRRLWADGWFTPHASGLAAALEQIVDVPAGSYLSFDPDRIMFLQEDRKDAADIFGVKSRAARALGDGGWEPDSIIKAVAELDISKLVAPAGGLPSVQLQQKEVNNDE